MTKDEVRAAFPINAQVCTKGGVLAHVSGYATYNLAFIGMRTFVELVDDAGRSLGEYSPSVLERIV